MSKLKKIFKKEHFKKDMALAACAALIFSLFITLAGFDEKCNDLRDGVLRLHILANSDSKEDQALKLKVRDSILNVSNGLFENQNTKAEAIEVTQNNIDAFKQAAIKTVRENGYDYSVEISVGKAYFDTRVYDDFTLPAGEYDAVKVLLGKAKGKNWWCVMFPSICITSAQKQDLNKSVNTKSAEIAKNPKKYEVRFKVVEWYYSLKNKFKSIF